MRGDKRRRRRSHLVPDVPPRRLRPDSGDRVVFHRTRGVTIALDVLQSFDSLVLASYWFTSPQRRNSGTPGPGKVDERTETKKKQTDKSERSTFISCTETLTWLHCKKRLQGRSAVYTDATFTHCGSVYTELSLRWIEFKMRKKKKSVKLS